ncbi:hypothetical protein BC567DRAFT_251240 [Phyllosticta citribraziliensis]
MGKEISDLWKQKVQVLEPSPDGGHQGKHDAIAHFNPECARNFVSQTYLQRIQFDLSLIRVVEEIPDCCAGRNVVGAVKLEFWGNDAPHDGQKIFMKQRTYRCTFFVVEDAEVDLTIGSRTIQDKGLAVRDMFDDFYALDGMNQGGFTFRHNPVGRELREEARRMQEERRAEYRRIRENAGYVPGPYSNAGN